jgi:DNA-binding CsgD family transcriptional regulator
MNDRMLTTMFSGVATDPPWQDFVRAMRLAFAGNHANVIFRRPELATQWMTHDTDAALVAIGDPVADYVANDDPLWYFGMPPFVSHTLDDFISPNEQLTHPLTQSYLWRYGMHALLICRVQVQDEMQAWLTVTRPRGSPFTADDKHRFEQIAHQFGPALELFGSYKEVLDQRDAYARALHARGTGLARLDPEGVVLHLDSDAERWVTEERLIQRRGHRLVAVRPQDQRRFDDAMKAVLSGVKNESLIVLQGEHHAELGDGLELLFYRVAEPHDPAWTHPPRVIIYMNMLGRQQLPSPQRLRQLFDLTGREAALTIVLARGLTVAEAAADLGLSPQTARAYLRQIFDKVGVTRQADLIRRIHASVAGIG